MLSLPISFKGQPGGDGAYFEPVQDAAKLLAEHHQLQHHQFDEHRKSQRCKFDLQTNLKFSKEKYSVNIKNKIVITAR